MRDSARRSGSAEPLSQSNPFWRLVFVPTYRALPWRIKRTMATTTSGVRGWNTDEGGSLLNRVAAPLERVAAPLDRIAGPIRSKARSLVPDRRPGKRAIAGIAGVAVALAAIARLLRRR